MAVIRWTKEQAIVALNMYCKIPFNQVTSTHPEIIKIAKIIGRSTNSLKMRIGNFWGDLAFESEKLIAAFSHQTLEESLQLEEAEFPQGRERASLIKTRVNQNFFRAAILSSYN